MTDDLRLPDNKSPDEYPPRRVTVREIVQTACEQTGVTCAMILGDCRKSKLVAVRHACMFAAWECGHSFRHIGRVMRRDHSSVAYGVRQAQQRLRAKKENGA